jgi:hypothetical protein
MLRFADSSRAMPENANDLPVAGQLGFLRVLAGPSEPARFLDVRWRTPGGPMRRRFVSAARVEQAARLLSALAALNDVYVGVALRDGHAHGGRAAISGSHLAWVESDDPHTTQRLATFAHPPTMIVASGTPGHLQLYWLLDQRCSVNQIESVNRSLALALAGDAACADGARILRPPDTLNHKHDPPRAVSLLVFRENAPFTLARLSEGLPADNRAPLLRRPRSEQRSERTLIDRELLAIPAAEYVRVLSGRSPNREGKVQCPFHADSDPSLQLYPDGGFYCFGSGCRKGGTIFDFAGYLWGINPRGAGFLELRNRLTDQFDPGVESVGVGLCVESAI